MENIGEEKRREEKREKQRRREQNRREDERREKRADKATSASLLFLSSPVQDTVSVCAVRFGHISRSSLDLLRLSSLHRGTHAVVFVPADTAAVAP